MVKNNRLEFKVTAKTKENLIAKVNGMKFNNLTDFIQYIAYNPIIVRIEFKKEKEQ